MYTYSFKKDQTSVSQSTAVTLTDGTDNVFVLWLDKSDLNKYETRSAAVDRIIQNAGYTDRQDFFEHKLNIERSKGLVTL